jgi:HEAT repeat protein
MDIIEAEISSGQSAEESTRRLQSLLEGENPWVRARAAKILYPLDQKTALQELKRLVTDASSGSQVPGMWALTELATEESLDLIVPLAYSPSREIQQGAIRSLVQLHSKDDLTRDVREKLNRLLPEIRSRTGWIF